MFVWLGRLVIVGGGSSVCGQCAPDEDVWCRLCWGGWLVVMGMLLYVLFEDMRQGAVGVRVGLVWGCVYGVKYK